MSTLTSSAVSWAPFTDGTVSAFAIDSQRTPSSSAKSMGLSLRAARVALMLSSTRI